MEASLEKLMSNETPRLQDAVEVCQQLLAQKLYSLLEVYTTGLLLLYPAEPNFVCAKAEALIALGHHEQAFDLLDSVCQFSMCNTEDIAQMTRRRGACIPHLRALYTAYPKDVVDRIVAAPPTHKLITFTVTTCKRLDLFEPTMNSFLNCCTDLHHIAEWVCVDDNSSEADRQRMKELYPFFRFILKGPEDKGHPRSMNILRREVRTPFVFHMEDDWLFIAKRPYLTMCMDVLASTPTYSQCLINLNYSETESDACAGGHLRSTATHFKFFEHEYLPKKEDLDAFMARHGRTVAYWPHYSFRPSLLRKEVWDVAPFREDPCHFEMEHANLLFAKGWRSAFLPGTYSLHTGKLTSESHAQKPNAYTLNETPQFGQASSTPDKTEKDDPAQNADPDQKSPDSEKVLDPAESSPETEISDTPKGKEVMETGVQIPATRNSQMFDLDQDVLNLLRTIQVAPVPHKVECHAINLKRRDDRWAAFQQKWTGFQRFDATDGKDLALTPAHVRLWGTNDHNWSSGLMGCAYSHMRLWHQLLVSDCSAYVVMEDDTEPTPLSPAINSLLGEGFNLEYDILFLGYSARREDWAPKNADGRVEMVRINNFGTASGFFLGGAFAYIISRRGAFKMLTMINSAGMLNAVDTMMLRLCDAGDVYFASRPLAVSRLANWDATADSDIQHNLYTRPIQGAEQGVTESHLLSLMSTLMDLGCAVSMEMPASGFLDAETAYVIRSEKIISLIVLPVTHWHYWVDRRTYVVLPERIRNRFEETEGWTLTRNGRFIL